jgi:hypothetical protein
VSGSDGVPTRVIVGSEARGVGCKARALLDAGERVAMFVGDPETDGELVDAFVADVLRA